jgi:hypothetical protein
MVKAPPADEARGVSIRGTRQRETVSRQVRVKAGTCGAPTKLYALARIGLTTLRLRQTKRSRNLRVWKKAEPTLRRRCHGEPFASGTVVTGDSKS